MKVLYVCCRDIAYIIFRRSCDFSFSRKAIVSLFFLVIGSNKNSHDEKEKPQKETLIKKWHQGLIKITFLSLVLVKWLSKQW